ncbi:MAG: transcriptional regulator NrdR [Chlamydiota bacterium]|jgi:transcriptional repressor NrdR
MKCPFCNHEESKVTDSRNTIDANAIRRRRECLSCQRRFTTFETLDLTIQVKKRDGTFEDFQTEKLVRGIAAACRHTRVSHDQVVALANSITKELIERQIRDINTSDLGKLVMERLKATDMVAYVRFACVYKRFKDVEDIMDVIESATKKGEAVK